MKILIIFCLFLLSCKKEQQCISPGNVVIVSKSIVTWGNNAKVIIEVKGLDNPYHFFIEPISTKEHRIEGHANVRVRSNCSEWSQWYQINY